MNRDQKIKFLKSLKEKSPKFSKMLKNKLKNKAEDMKNKGSNGLRDQLSLNTEESVSIDIIKSDNN